jgi:hypothetical protein
MKKWGVVSMTALIVAGALPAFAQSHSHDAAPATQAMLQPGAKWATDAPLRAGMDGIRSGVAELRAKEQFAVADYRRLADGIDAHVASIVANCKLAPEADASLHGVIAELAAASDEMRKPWPEPARGLHRAKQALDTYQRTFDHAGFRPVG